MRTAAADVAGFTSKPGGVVAIEAEHYAARRRRKAVEWLRVPGHGRTLSGHDDLAGRCRPRDVARGMRLDYDGASVQQPAR
jgi:hypothetical protein